jgi:MYXO-CTERM domain-containing protein
MRSLRSTLVLTAGSIASFGLVFASPPMVSTADGCSGAASYPKDDPSGGWESLSYPDGVTLPTDGVIVLRGRRHSYGEANAKGVSVTVTDPSAQEVPGKLWIEPSDGQWPAVTYVAWKANAPLQAGVTYSVAWHTDGSLQYGTTIDGTTTFDVADTVALLPDLQTTLPTSDRTNALSGPRVLDCRDNYTCNIPPFGAVEIQPYGMRFTVKPPSDPDTYQALSVREVSGKGSFAETYDTPWAKRRKVMASPWLEPQEMTVWFKEELPEYCVQLVQRDLRTGVEREQPLCALRSEQAALAGPVLKDFLALCWGPPDGFLQPWCDINPTREQCENVPPTEMDAGSSPTDGGSGASAPSDSGAPDSSGCGCRSENRPPAQGAFLFAVLMATFIGRRRTNN